jgi:outer membrane cobalamin receptor
MRALLLSLVTAHALSAQAATPEGQNRPRFVCVRDATTSAAVSYARVRSTRDDNRARLTSADGCVVLGSATDWPAGTPLEVSRIGYTSQMRAVATSVAGQRVDTTFVELTPLAALLTSSTVVGAAPFIASSGERNAVTVNSDSARAIGVATTGALVALLPYTFPRSSRGEVTLSLRGARREQVAVTLDGVSLSDPATGVADLADVPLAMLGSATVSPGSDGINTGPGAAGGVLALTSSSAPVVSVRLGAFGDALTEGAWTTTVGGARVRVGGAHRVAENDFAFVNTATTTGSAVSERRVNNDVTRTNAMVQVETARTQLFVLASRASLGLVGPVNVRDYDNDRSATTRIFTRGTLQAGRALFSLSSRAFSLAYRDPARPEFNSLAEAIATDIDARGRVRGVLMHAGFGGDALRASQDVRQRRGRAFAAVQMAREARGVMFSGGVRTDVISESGVLPSFSVAAQRQLHRVTIGGRIAQAVRAPTLYDLYFSSPQRLAVRALEPERVVLDAELFARWRPAAIRNWRTSADVALVRRDTRNAIVWFPGNFGWSPSNVGREHMYGVESRVSFEHARAAISAWSTLYAPTLVSGSLRIPTPYVPANAGGGNARIAIGPLQLGLAARVLGPRPFTAGPRDPAFMLPQVALIDGALSTHRAFHRVDALFSIAVDNISDRAWQSVRGFPSPGRAWSVALTIRPIAP